LDLVPATPIAHSPVVAAAYLTPMTQQRCATPAPIPWKTAGSPG